MAKAERTVLIIGGGVAALAAAHALVEWNKKTEDNADVEFKFRIYVINRDDIWGGRASSWPGGHSRPHGAEKHWDFDFWPEELPLNHGFHAIWSRTTYANFMHMLEDVWEHTTQELPRLIGETLISNKREILIYENERVCSLKIHSPNKYSWPLNSHLTDATTELLTRGGWSPLEVKNFKDVILNEVIRYKDFEKLSQWDKYQGIAFKKWCQDRCIRDSLFNKGIYKFIFDGTYIAPFEMDATSGLMALWILLRNYEAAEWFYINGGISKVIHEPIMAYLDENKDVQFYPGVELDYFVRDGNRITGVEFSQPRFKEHYYGQGETKDLDYKEAKLKEKTGVPLVKTELLPEEKLNKLKADAPQEAEKAVQNKIPESIDYYISTLPLDNFYEVLCRSEMDNSACFRNISNLKKSKFFTQPVGTVNLQVWFKKGKTNLLGPYKNVIAGLEPLCIAIDYKKILPIYQDDMYGSVLEINGSLQELSEPESSGYWELKDRDLKIFEWPDTGSDEARKQAMLRTIEFAKRILKDLARRYKLEELEEAVENEDFLEWPDNWPNRKNWNETNKIPPFLWKNTDPYNRFFVTGPGTLDQRPWIWNEGYPDNLFLAGDWTRNGFDIPSMEGAARSGRMAARALLLSAFGKNPDIDPRDPEPENTDYPERKRERHRVPEGKEGIKIYSPDQREN